MAEPLYVNGRFTTTDEKVIGVEDRGFQFGDGVYEVVKFLGRRPRLVAEHYRRLKASLSALEIPLILTGNDFDALIRELIARADVDDGLFYLQVTRGDCPRVHFYPEDCAPTVVAYVRSFVFPGREKKERGARVIVIPDDRWHRCNIKSVNLLANTLAKKKAQRAGAEEALFTADGFIREGASSNFFVVTGDRIVTHPAGPHVLAGTVRDKVISLALANRIRVDERPIQENELPSIEEAFLTSTTQSVMPVVEIDGKIIANGRRGGLTERIQTLYDEFDRSEEEGRR